MKVSLIKTVTCPSYLAGIAQGELASKPRQPILTLGSSQLSSTLSRSCTICIFLFSHKGGEPHVSTSVFFPILAAIIWSTSDTLSSVQCSCSVVSDSFNPMDCSMPGFPVHHHLLKLTQTHVHRIGDAIQPSHPLPSPSSPALNLPQHQGLFQWVSSLYQVAKVLELQLQHQPFQWIFRTNFL